ncbi:uncharacterized protein LOC144626359 isoform X2 [Crassostrea virginica]
MANAKSVRDNMATCSVWVSNLLPPTYTEAISTGESSGITYEDQCSSGQLRGQTLKRSLSCIFHDPGQFSPPYLQDGSVNQFYHHSHTSPNPVLNQFHLPPDGVSVHNYSLSDVALSDNCQNLQEDVASKSMQGDLGEYQFGSDGKEKDGREKQPKTEAVRTREPEVCGDWLIPMLMSFLAVFFFFPAGIIAVIASFNARSAQRAGNMKAAQEHYNTTHILIRAALIAGMLNLICVVLLVVIITCVSGARHNP